MRIHYDSDADSCNVVAPAIDWPAYGKLSVVSNLPVDQHVRKALVEAKRELLERFPVERIILFGSAARGELEPESDIDLLIVTSDPLDRETRHQITDLIFEINLRHDTNLSTVVVDRESWNHGLISALPFREEVEAQGIVL